MSSIASTTCNSLGSELFLANNLPISKKRWEKHSKIRRNFCFLSYPLSTRRELIPNQFPLLDSLSSCVNGCSHELPWLIRGRRGGAGFEVRDRLAFVLGFWVLMYPGQSK